jgi:hypothetical protein
LYTHAFVWLDRFLMGERRPIEGPALKQFEPEQLKVFEKLPDDQINTKIHETFVPAAPPPKVPEDKDEWAAMRDEWMKALREKVFRGWPQSPCELNLSKVFEVEREGIRFAAYDFDSQPSVRLRLFVMDQSKSDKPKAASLEVLDHDAWQAFLAIARPAFGDALTGLALPDENVEGWKSVRKEIELNWPHAWVAPRGVGLSAWDSSPKNQLHSRRRFMLLGQTLAGMQVYDARRAMQALRTLKNAKDVKLTLGGDRDMAIVALYASLFEPDIVSLTLRRPPVSHDAGPDLLNVRRYLDLPAAAGMAAERAELRIYASEPAAWEYLSHLQGPLGWDDLHINIQGVPAK